MEPENTWVYSHVMDALQAAEEIGGPEGADYDALMEAIIAACKQRIENHRTQQQDE